jgi:hypothetical protein
MSYSEFCKAEHQKRVKHFVNFIKSDTTHSPTIQDAIEIFGFCERDAREIFNDAICIK